MWENWLQEWTLNYVISRIITISYVFLKVTIRSQCLCLQGNFRLILFGGLYQEFQMTSDFVCCVYVKEISYAMFRTVWKTLAKYIWQSYDAVKFWRLLDSDFCVRTKVVFLRFGWTSHVNEQFI